jgi:hypothetical protein
VKQEDDAGRDQLAVSITLQYFDGCPNWRQAEKELTKAVDGLGIDAEIVYEKIESQDRAEEVGFRGSPTILISGRDPFSDPDAPVGLSCRVFRTAEKASGSPGVDALRQVLRTDVP